jgi:hypothetical protein
MTPPVIQTPKKEKTVSKLADGTETRDDIINFFKDEGISYEENTNVYEILATVSMDELVPLYALLKNEQIDYAGNEWLYHAAIQHIDKIVPAFAIMNSAGISYAENERLYQPLMCHINCWHWLEKAFSLFKRRGMSFADNKDMYASAVYSIRNLNKIQQVFNIVEDLDVPDSNPKLYEALIDSIRFISKIQYAFTAFKDIGIFYSGNEDLYKKVINYPVHADNIVSAFRVLNALITPFSDSKVLYLLVIEQSYNADKIPVLLNALRRAGIFYQENKLFYYDSVSRLYNAEQLASSINALNKAAIPFLGNEELYRQLIFYPRQLGDPAKAFIALNKAGLPYRGNETLYSVFFERRLNHEVFLKICTALSQAGVEFSENKLLYNEALKTEHDADKIVLALKKLKDAGIHYEVGQSPNYVAIAIRHCEVSIKALHRIIQAHYSFKKHPEVFRTLFQYLDKPDYSLNRLMQLVNKICELHQTQQNLNANDLKVLMLDVLENHYRFGPLEKRAETGILEHVLEQLVSQDISTVHFHYQESIGYILKLKDQPEINISLLLRYANPGHFTFSDELVKKMGAVLAILEGKKVWKHQGGHNSSIFAPGLIDSVSLIALENYISERYRNINLLFRGERLDPGLQHKWLLPLMDTRNVLANFLCGCLVSNIANKLSNDNGEGANVKKLLVRKEVVDSAMQKSRSNGVVRLPSLTSFSRRPDGSPCFREPGLTTTFLDGVNLPIINPKEGEVILPPGEHLIYTCNPDGHYNANIVRSPDIHTPGSYRAMMALTHAFTYHLNIRYKDKRDDVVINERRIERPNHGLAHTYDVIVYLDIFIDHFASFAKENGFREFCCNIPYSEKEWLGVAGAFSVSGRESEIAAIDNLKRYDEFREASAGHFDAFLSLYPPAVKDDAMRERVRHVLRYMGNPAYEQSINTHPDPEERMHRNYLHRLLTLAHKLDLVRCYNPHEFKRAMHSVQQLSIDSPQQVSAYNQIIEYAIKLCKAHGNMLATDINKNNELIPVNINYHTPFAEVSLSVLSLLTISDGVKMPDKPKARSSGSAHALWQPARHRNDCENIKQENSLQIR